MSYPWEWNIIFPGNKKILNLCLRWYILRSYHFVAEVNFKEYISRQNKHEVRGWPPTSSLHPQKTIFKEASINTMRQIKDTFIVNIVNFSHHSCQAASSSWGIIQTKMVIVIRFWMPNLGLSFGLWLCYTF